jgi:hypothetical protein
MAIGDFLYTKDTIWAEERVPVDNCAICRDALASKAKVTKLACNHFFCSEEIDNWKQARANPKCPICSQTITDRLVRLENTYQNGETQPCNIFKREVNSIYTLRHTVLKKIMENPVFRIAVVPFNLLHWAVYGITIAIAEVIKKISIAIDGLLAATGLLIAAAVALPLSPFLALYIFGKMDPNLSDDQRAEIRKQRFQRVLKTVACIVMPLVGLLAAAWLKCYRPAANYIASKIVLPMPQHTPKSIWNNSLIQHS